MQSIDLNLLVALDALLTEESVTRAAQRLNVGVPVMSRTLSRIRDLLGDPVLVRAGRNLALTSRALELRGRVHTVVQGAQDLLRASSGVTLGQLKRTFTIRACDSVYGTIEAPMFELMARVAPGITLRFLPEGEEDVGALRTGTVDIDIGVAGPLGPEIRIQTLFRDNFVGVARAGHSLLSGEVTAQRFAECRHVSLSRRGRTRGPIDLALKKKGLERQVVLAVPTGFAAVQMAALSDLVAAVPQTFAMCVKDRFDVCVFSLPVPTPPLVISQAWHPRFDTDHSHRWLRECVRKACRLLPCTDTAH